MTWLTTLMVSVCALALVVAVRSPRAGRVFLRSIQSLWVGFSLVAIAWLFVSSGTSSAHFIAHPAGAFEALFHFDWSAYDQFATNYAFAWRTGRMGQYFLNSLLVTTSAVLLCTALSAPAAYALARTPVPGKALLGAALAISLAIPGFLIVTPLFLNLRDFALGSIHVVNSRAGLAILYAVLGIPFSVLVLAEFFRKLPSELGEAAAMEGATPWYVFRKVYFPLAAPGIATVMVFNFLAFWNEYNLALILLTNPRYLTLPVGLYNLALSQRYAINEPVVMAGIMILFFPTLIVFLAMQERIVAGLTTGAVKE